MTKKISFKILMFTLFYLVLMIWMINIGIYKDLILLSFMILYYFTSVRQLIAEYKTKMIDPANKIAIHKANIVNFRNNVVESLIIFIIYGTIIYFKHLPDLFATPYYMLIFLPAGGVIGYGVRYFMEKEELQIALNKRKTTSQ
ncbi:hypothetical protein ETI06_00550 [Macrococcoides goetzii]|nr:hypothetical protein [Macrococcus goetzii]TDM48478.1 hypothetical protein ETI08_04855 [Macrococcus goetzii]TDM50498.1 hypothetical protein ETI06_00550 [Macrococcus goetzii]